MVFITGKYGTNHPKDVAARRMRDAAKLIKEQGCTRSQLDKPTEANIKHCMKEMQATSRMGERFKEDAKFLGENSNLDRHRRR